MARYANRCLALSELSLLSFGEVSLGEKNYANRDNIAGQVEPERNWIEGLGGGGGIRVKDEGKDRSRESYIQDMYEANATGTLSSGSYFQREMIHDRSSSISKRFYPGLRDARKSACPPE
ncbi:hypothetical protein KM043_014996 [Ampulex compressa]|nr:hypothetical protein KM043_014996 [Ampulex compressa]